MRIFTNPGSNLSPRCLAHYDIALAPQQIVVDGVSHDTRQPISLREVDEWVNRSREYPYVVGATALGMLDLYLESFKGDRQLLGVTTSKKIIQSYQAAESAARTVKGRPSYSDARIALVDSGVTDVGTGLVCIAAGEAARAGLPLAKAAAVAEAMSQQGVMLFYVPELQRLVKGGRAGAVRAWLAEKLDRRPMLSFVDGEVASIATVRAVPDPAEVLARAARERLGARRRVWLGIAHGGVPDLAATSLAACRQQFDVAFAYVRPLSPSIYLHAGPRSVMIAVYPVDQLGWEPTTPPSDLE